MCSGVLLFFIYCYYAVRTTNFSPLTVGFCPYIIYINKYTVIITLRRVWYRVGRSKRNRAVEWQNANREAALNFFFSFFFFASFTSQYIYSRLIISSFSITNSCLDPPPLQPAWILLTVTRRPYPTSNGTIFPSVMISLLLCEFVVTVFDKHGRPLVIHDRPISDLKRYNFFVFFWQQ